MPQEVEIVLTAHPTQINRRTLQYKHLRVAVSLTSVVYKTYFSSISFHWLVAELYFVGYQTLILLHISFLKNTALVVSMTDGTAL